MKITQQGFTLIELMVVVAVIGVLATIGLPAYSAYTDRTKISEILLVSDSAKRAVSEYFMTVGQMPTTINEANINVDTNQSNYISAISFATTPTSATLTYTVTNMSANGDVALVATSVGGNALKWSCSTPATTVARNYLPNVCR